MKNYVLGRWLVLIGALGALIAFVFWTVSLQDLQNWFAQYGLQLGAVMLIVTALLVVELPGRRQTRLAMQDASKEQGLEPPEAKDKAVFAAKSAQAAELEGLGNLRAVLRADFGWRWRYKLPWLMLNGDNAAIGRLLPNLREQGWSVSSDAVLLWGRSGADGQSDAAWLKHVCRLRRRRPIDAVVLVTDGDKDLPTQRRGTDAPGIRLARIAEILRWSAPL